MLDADGSTDPEEIPRFLAVLVEGNDFAKGSRFLQGGGSRDISHLRLLGNYCLSQLVNVLFWTRFSDLCYGYNAFWKHCLDKLEIDCDGFEVETLMNLRIHKARLKIVEVPSFEYPRMHGRSNLRTFRDGWRVLKTIIKESIIGHCFHRTICERSGGVLRGLFSRRKPPCTFEDYAARSTSQLDNIKS
jgi:hypothetical protein